MKPNALAANVTAILALIAVGPILHAQVYSAWNGGNGLWGNPNWSAGVPTDNSFDARVDGGKNLVASTLNIDANYTVGRVVIDPGDGISFDVPRTFRVLGGATLVGAGTLENNGTITFDAGQLLVAENFQLGRGETTLINHGTLIAADTGNRHLLLTPGSGGLLNTGTVGTTGFSLGRRSFGGQLDLSGSAGGVVQNTGGVISAFGPSSIQLIDNVRVVGGTLSTGGLPREGQLSSLSSTLVNVINLGNITDALQSTSVTTLVGTFANQGTAALSGDFRLGEAGAPDVTLAGAGSVQLFSGSAGGIYYPARLFAATNGGRLTVDAGQTLFGNGEIGLGQTALTNRGTIIAFYASNPLNVQPAAAGLVGAAVNDGTFRAVNGATLVLSGASGGTFTNNGTFDVADRSTISVSAGALTNFNGTTLTGGTYNVTATASNTSTLFLNNSQVLVNQGTVILSGANALFPAIDSLQENRGTFELTNSRTFLPAVT